ncbi:winged helix-turn-helix domain-containing protein [Tahibacter amnicola]|uniref:Helix-turn-helix domain-containing protein n=1 Tax=Tahibacter amnicola TaxID=2976241 RepID=A0ABY6BEJ6_9GAMM|nr:helix-turn-helix domain-containing protein [Tahibacter amnicola]UXI68453.1 helix-turn-helix domain-containing protein [Tahibacter amnicola]
MESPREIRALATSARQELIDTLEALGGEATVAQLAENLGKPADGLYYHLRVLVKAGLLVDATGEDGVKRFRSTAGPGARLQLRYVPRQRKNREAVNQVVASLLRNASRDFERAIENPDVVVEGPARALWASRTKGWVGERELVEINQLLHRLGALLHKKRAPERDQLIALAWVLAPMDVRVRGKDR